MAARRRTFAARSRAAIARLESEGVPSAPLAAELLLMHVLGRDRACLYAHPEHALDADQAARFAQLIEQRAAGTPVQYLTGRQEFWGLEFEVNPGVLIPRPETEHVIEVALARLGARRARSADASPTSAPARAASPWRWLASCRKRTSSPPIFPPAALEVAARNAARHGVAARIEFRRANFLRTYLAGLAPDQALLRFDREQPALHRPRRSRELAARSSRPRAAGSAFRRAGRHGRLSSTDCSGGKLCCKAAAGWSSSLAKERPARGAAAAECALGCDAAIERDLAGIDRVLSAQRARARLGLASTSSPLSD